MDNFQEIRNDNRLLYEYVRGSHLYGLNNADSDVDTGGVFICTPKQAIGFLNYQPQVSDERHDNTWYEIGNLAELLMKSNPTVLESLFIPKEKVIGDIHPYMQMFIDNRDQFVTKECFNPFYGYAKAQIEKARGLNKKMMKEVTVRNTPLEYCYIFKDGGDLRLNDYMNKTSLKHNYCGLVHISHLQDCYAVYYDWGNHIIQEKLSFENFKELVNKQEDKFEINKDVLINNYDYFKEHPYGFRGMIDEKSLSNELRLSSIPKGIEPIFYMGYNASDYSRHCIEYKQYQEWVKMRNPKRYESNLNKNYDSKNMSHCFRMVHMAKEIAEGQGIILDRTGIDRDFLMDVRSHKFEYDELMEMLVSEKDNMDKAMRESTIPEQIDRELVNDILVEIRKSQIKNIL